MRPVSLIAATILAGLIAALGWAWYDRPVPVDVSWNGPLASVSFAPFRRGQNPLTENFPPFSI